MFSRTPTALVLLCLLAVYVVAFEGRQDEAAPDENRATMRGLLVLRNGNVLQGQILRTLDGYRLRKETGSELRIPDNDVEFVARDIYQALKQKRMNLPEGDIPARLDLAKWCIRHGLFSGADQQLQYVAVLDHRNEELPGMRRRLDEVYAKVRQQATAPKPDNNTKPDLGATVDTSNIAQAGLTIEVDEEDPDGENTSDAVDAPFLMEELPSSVSPEAIRMYTLQVQPLLMNRCATGGCHGPSPESEFQLERARRMGGTTNITRRNLRETLRWVNQESPSLSKLVKTASSPHGPNNVTYFGAGQRRQRAMLLEWIAKVGGDKVHVPVPGFFKPENPVPLSQRAQEMSDQRREALMRRNDALGRRMDSESSQSPDEAADLASHNSPSEVPADTADSEMTDNEPDQPKKPQFGAKVDFFKPRDPFDPEIFNRQFSANK